MRPARKWYGGYTLLADGLAFGAAALAAGAESGEILVTSMAGYALGAPIAHWGQGRVGTGFMSLGLRVGAPLAGLYLGYTVGCSSGGTRDCINSLIGGLAVGVLTPVVLDAAVFAWRPLTAQEKQRVSLRLGASPGRVSLGLGGEW